MTNEDKPLNVFVTPRGIYTRRGNKFLVGVDVPYPKDDPTAEGKIWADDENTAKNNRQPEPDTTK